MHFLNFVYEICGVFVVFFRRLFCGGVNGTNIMPKGRSIFLRSKRNTPIRVTLSLASIGILRQKEKAVKGFFKAKTVLADVTVRKNIIPR